MKQGKKGIHFEEERETEAKGERGAQVSAWKWALWKEKCKREIS